MKKWKWVIVCVFAFGCAKETAKPAEPIAVSKNKSTNVPKNKPVLKQESLPPTAKECEEFTATAAPKFPMYVQTASSGFMLTKFSEECITSLGSPGIVKGAGWVSLGVPCTGAMGRILITGKNYNPKVLSFPLGTDCGMSPSTEQEMQVVLNRQLGVKFDHRMMAQYPLDVQYWEVSGSEEGPAMEAGVGNVVELKAMPNLRQFWDDFKIGKQKVLVKLVGKENSWTQQNEIYEATGEIRFRAPYFFTIQLKTMRALDEEQSQLLLSRCTSLRPQRNCAGITRG